MWGKFTEPNKINIKVMNAKDNEIKRNQFITDYVPFILKFFKEDNKINVYMVDRVVADQVGY